MAREAADPSQGSNKESESAAESSSGSHDHEEYEREEGEDYEVPGFDEEPSEQDSFSEDEEEEPTDSDDYFSEEEDGEDLTRSSDFDEEEDSDAEDEDVDHVNEAEELSTISNETERSNLEEFEAKRQTAQIIPEAPWSGARTNVVQCVVAVMLPAILVLLLIYAVLKCLQGLLTLIGDVWVVARQLILLAFRIALIPLYIIWRLMPKTMQIMLLAEYERRAGHRVKKVRKCIALGKAILLDLPNISTACFRAALETCCIPAKRLLGICCWKLVGVYVNRWVTQPLMDAHVNHSILKKRQAAGFWRKEQEAKKKSMVRESKGRKKRVEARERAKRLRAKKKREQLEIVLSIEVTKSGKAKERRVQLEDRSSSLLVSRTMILQRRYAIVVGFVWCLIGLTIMVLVLDGTETERCTICENNLELGVRICRHGIGRDCAFHLHSNQVLIAVGFVGVGMMLLAYSVFLYKPSGFAAQATASEHAAKKELEEALFDPERAEDDPELRAVKMIRADLNRLTLPRLVRSIYRRTPCFKFQQFLANLFLGPLYSFGEWENRHHLPQRSVNIQYVLYLMAGGWVILVRDCVKKHLNSVADIVFGPMGTSGDQSRSLRCCLMASACLLGDCCCCCIFRTTCGRKLLTRLSNSLVGRLSRRVMGLSTEGSAKQPKSIVSSGGRGRRGPGGQMTLQEVLEQFDLDARDPDQLEAELRKRAELENNLQSDLRKKAFEELTSGLAETQREAGLNRQDLEPDEELVDIGDVDDVVQSLTPIRQVPAPRARRSDRISVGSSNTSARGGRGSGQIPMDSKHILAMSGEGGDSSGDSASSESEAEG